jgi:hypothetical protein
MPWSPVEVLAGVSFRQAEQAIALLRVAGIPVNARKVPEEGPPSVSLRVAAADEEQALRLLWAHGFPVPRIPAEEPVVLRPATGAGPGDDVWSLLTQQEPPWPSVYSFP